MIKPSNHSHHKNLVQATALLLQLTHIVRIADGKEKELQKKHIVVCLLKSQAQYTCKLSVFYLLYIKG